MAEQMTLAVQKRTEMGKGPNRQLRAQGIVPGIYYNAQGENIPVQISALLLEKAYKKLGTNHVFQLVIEDNGSSVTRPALFWKVVPHPYKRMILHVDLYGVDLDKPIKLIVPVEVVGENNAVKLGAVLEVYRDNIEIICLPMSIPNKIEIDISPLAMNQSVHAKDLVLPEGVSAVYDENFAVLGIHAPEVEEEAEAEAETE